MSVTHKKSEKQIGAAELEALRASIMAEVEAARAETEESIISSIRNNLVSLPEQGEEWNEKKSYITGLHGSASAKKKAQIRERRANRHKK